MVEIRVAAPDPTLVHSLMRRLRLLFDPSSVAYDGRRKEIRVCSEWESRAVVGVVEAVQGWIAEADAGSTRLEVGDRSYTLGAPSRSNETVETKPHIPALATVSAVVQAAREANDSATLLDRMCESVAENLDFDRAVIARYSAEDDLVEAVASHALPLRSVTGVTTSAEEWPILRRARDTGALVLADAPATAANVLGAIAEAYDIGAIVVVPLVSGDRCLGFLAADRGGAAFDLDDADRDLLTTLGTILADMLQRALDHDELLERVRRKSDFIAFASHELRRPAAAVCGVAETLHFREHAVSAEQRSTLLEVLHEQGRRLHHLVEQLLDLSGLEGGSLRVTPRPLAVRERIEGIVRGVAPTGEDEIDILIKPDLRAAADPDGFDRIVSNLILNALTYGEQPITVSAAVQDRHFRLTVEDRGAGVPADLAPRLFDRFARGNRSAAPGAGLGLSIAQAYARAHGGQLLYENAAPHGARFQLVVPVEAAHSNRSDRRGERSLAGAGAGGAG